MDLVQNILNSDSAIEPEETNAPVDNVVKSSPFQGEVAGSSPARSTTIISRIAFKGWKVERTFNTINGNKVSRLSIET